MGAPGRTPLCQTHWQGNGLLRRCSIPQVPHPRVTASGQKLRDRDGHAAREGATVARGRPRACFSRLKDWFHYADYCSVRVRVWALLVFLKMYLACLMNV